MELKRGLNNTKESFQIVWSGDNEIVKH